MRTHYQRLLLGNLVFYNYLSIMRKKFFLAVSAAIVAAVAIGGVYVVNNSPVAGVSNVIVL